MNNEAERAQNYCRTLRPLGVGGRARERATRRLRSESRLLPCSHVQNIPSPAQPSTQPSTRLNEPACLDAQREERCCASSCVTHEKRHEHSRSHHGRSLLTSSYACHRYIAVCAPSHTRGILVVHSAACAGGAVHAAQLHVSMTVAGEGGGGARVATNESARTFSWPLDSHPHSPCRARMRSRLSYAVPRRMPQPQCRLQRSTACATAKGAKLLPLSTIAERSAKAASAPRARTVCT